MNKILHCGKFSLDFSRPLVMGVLNVTPDSFSDGGHFSHLERALEHALAMREQGADIIDIGGESTRPGATPVSVQEEMNRVIPVIEVLSEKLDIPLSIDTRHAEVMREAVGAGAGMINDVMALQNEDSLTVAAQLDVPVCLMHMQGLPETMQDQPDYRDVIAEIREFFEARIQACVDAGIKRERLLIDPGFGFGKTLEHNLIILEKLQEFTTINLPVLVGVSRKSMIGTLLGNAPVEQRLAGSLAAAVMLYERGAGIIRVHDVKETVDALKVVQAVTTVVSGQTVQV